MVESLGGQARCHSPQNRKQAPRRHLSLPSWKGKVMAKGCIRFWHEVTPCPTTQAFHHHASLASLVAAGVPSGKGSVRNFQLYEKRKLVPRKRKAGCPVVGSAAGGAEEESSLLPCPKVAKWCFKGRRHEAEAFYIYVCSERKGGRGNDCEAGPCL